MNMLDKMFFYKKKNILSIYFTAGFPNLESTINIINILQKYCIDLIEIGIPYSDSLADGMIIQNSSKKSLINGMNLNKLFAQLQCIKKNIYIPIILMGYYNSFFKFGKNFFLNKCKQIGISGVITPDITDNNHIKKYQKLFKKFGLYFILLITIHTPIERIFSLTLISKGFLYLVSSTSTTGKKFIFHKKKDEFFTFLKRNLKLNIPKLIGFGISNKDLFKWSCYYSEGGIIGSSFIKSLNEDNIEESIKFFMQLIKGNK